MSIPSAEADDQKQTTEFELLSDTFKLLKKQNKNIKLVYQIIFSPSMFQFKYII